MLLNSNKSVASSTTGSLHSAAADPAGAAGSDRPVDRSVRDLRCGQDNFYVLAFATIAR